MRAMGSFGGAGRRTEARRRTSEQIESRKDGGTGPLQRSVLEALRMDDRLEIEQRHLEKSVNYNEVEVPSLRHLDPCIRHAPLDDLRIVLAAALQARKQLVPARRQKKDEHGVREEPLDLN